MLLLQVENTKSIPVKEELVKEQLQNGSVSKSNTSVLGQYIKNGTAHPKVIDQIVVNADSSEGSPTPIKPDEDSEVDVPAIEEDMNLEELMRQKVCFKLN